MFEQTINLIYKMYTWLLEKEYAKNVKVKFKKAQNAKYVRADIIFSVLTIFVIA